MKRRTLFALALALPLLSAFGTAQALEIQPYSAAALQQRQAGGSSVAVHFHAEWCSTCKAQEEAFKALRNDPQLKDITLLVADYDKERELKRALKVRAQSVVVIFKGEKETGRINGETKPELIKSSLLKAL